MIIHSSSFFMRNARVIYMYAGFNMNLMKIRLYDQYKSLSKQSSQETEPRMILLSIKHGKGY